ncbi:curved DNA-binding protein [Affinibrenneria salicis]|uniref:Curved DNA-binding protein n=1 Tax=Affinibrenneria salicis TaxID=2590031 RepID=A0A5J5FQL2_9GAMM|nr:curved DNA-binding protein [Affinibrenneria salicis]KAA8995276.1 curved DNA-binding protein [Affinibrenneria salicis]
MEFKDYYAILGVKPADDLKAIKTAYRRLARKYHPDVSSEAEAESKFKEVAEAYEVLKDSERRAEYDQLRQHRDDPDFGRQWQRPGGDTQRQGAHSAHAGQDFSDFFESIFGGRGGYSQHFDARGGGAQAMRGQDVEMECAMLLEETLSEQSRTIEYRLPVYDVFGRQEREVPKTLNVRIPAGVGDRERIRLKGQGVAGVNGGPNGDLYLTIRIAPHPLFDINGHDLQIVVPLAPWEAALGARVAIPTLTGQVSMTIPPGSQTGQRLRIKGKGLVNKKTTGDLYAALKVVMPPRPDDKTAELWQQLADAQASFNPRTEWK